ASSGTATYTASAPGFESAKGTVTLTPSGILIAGPARFGNPLISTPGAWASKLSIYAARLDEANKFVEMQQVRGGFTANVQVTSSDPKIASIATPALAIPGGEFTAMTL